MRCTVGGVNQAEAGTLNQTGLKRQTLLTACALTGLVPPACRSLSEGHQAMRRPVCTAPRRRVGGWPGNRNTRTRMPQRPRLLARLPTDTSHAHDEARGAGARTPLLVAAKAALVSISVPVLHVLVCFGLLSQLLPRLSTHAASLLLDPSLACVRTCGLKPALSRG